MRIRYASYLSLGVAAAFVVVATAAFSLPTIAALALAFGIGWLAVSLAVVALSTGRAVGRKQYPKDMVSALIGGAIAVVSAWTIVQSQVFSLSTVDNLTFASALAVGALSVIGLTAHELRAERVVHSLEVHEGQGEREPDRRIAA
jgi:hypothetical protein